MTTTRPSGTRLSSPDGAPFASSWRRSQLTVDQRVARGRAARREAPRSEHGRWEPAPDRRDPVALLEEQAASRVPELVPIRYGRMLVSPFTFYRGAAAIMAADLATTPVTGITVQLFLNPGAVPVSNKPDLRPVAIGDEVFPEVRHHGSS